MKPTAAKSFTFNHTCITNYRTISIKQRLTQTQTLVGRIKLVNTIYQNLLDILELYSVFTARRYASIFHVSFSLPVPFQFQFQFCSSFIKPADDDVLLICLNTIHRQSRIQCCTAVAPVSALLCVLVSFQFSQYMVYQMVATAVTLNNLEGHSPLVDVFKCNSFRALCVCNHVQVAYISC